MPAALIHAARLSYLIVITTFIFAPIIVILLVSVSSAQVFDLPRDGFSLQWYSRLFDKEELWSAVGLSTQIAVAATLTSVLIGTLFSFALVRYAFPGSGFALTFALSPMMLPGVVIAIALLFAFRAVGLRNSYASLMLAHVIITLPYVVRVLYAGMATFNYSMLEVAFTLGCNLPQAIWRVLIPVIFPSIVTAGLFAFLVSFDNYALALFLGDYSTVTLPVQMLKYIESAADPSLAAVSSLLVLLSIVVIVISERLIGARRLLGDARAGK